MQIGTLRERITVQRRTTDPATKAVTWPTVAANVPASVLPASTRELLQAQAMSASVQYSVTIRFRTDVTQAMRVLWRSVVLQIHSVVDPDGRRRELKLLCEATNPGVS